MPADGARLTTEAAGVRLAALGFADPKAALRHLEALTSGLSRTAAIQRTLLPAMLEWFADAPDPDAGLFGFRRISESLGSSHWYLKTLRDEGQVAERLARVLATSRYATDLLEREPEGVRMLGGDLTPLSSEAVLAQMRATADRQDDPVEAVRSIRALRRRELLRIAVGELFGETEVAEVGAALSRLTDATLQATLDVAGRSVRAQRGLDEAPTRMAVVAMGRYGGFELSYGSDADVLFVHEPLDDAADAGRRRHGVRPGGGQRAPCPADRARRATRRSWSTPTCARRASRVRWCARSRRTPPTTRSGRRSGRRRRCCAPTRWSATRACASGSPRWSTRCATRPTASATPTSSRYAGSRRASTASGCPAAPTPRPTSSSAAAGSPTSSGPCSCSSSGTPARVAGPAQPAHPDRARRRPRGRDLLSDADADALDRAWRTVSRLRNAITLVTGKSGDQLPRDARERAAVASILGYGPGRSDEMVNDYLRTTRRARAVVDRVFWE